MSIRLLLLSAIIIGLALYAWRDWFKSLCGLILLTTILEHPEMPKHIMGIQGLNPWNTLLAVVVVAWLCARRREGLRWDLPGYAGWVFLGYVGCTFVAYVRGVFDLSSFPSEHRESFLGFTTDEIINPIKLMVPGLMLYDGARSRKRIVLALTCVLLVGVGFALQIIKYVPLGVLVDPSDFMKFRYRINRNTGMDPNDIAMILVGTFWSMMATLVIWKRRRGRVLVAGAAAVLLVGIGLCQSRAGYVSFVGVGMLFGIFIWRPLLGILPMMGIVVFLAVPSIPARLGMGFAVGNASSQTANDLDVITAGRMTKIWPPVFEQISASPLIGEGRRAILRTPVHKALAKKGIAPGHPHNAYLEVLLDAGVAGLFVILALYGLLFGIAIRLCRTPTNALVRAIGGAALAMISALLITGLSSQSLFPTTSLFGMWCVIGLMLRAFVLTRSNATADAQNLRRRQYHG
ncbi:MAG: O-antigen ligase family protein [Planctomycetes bacterium]|nr:O-antigen ligase family protein [Planctomycetota bacterium]